MKNYWKSYAIIACSAILIACSTNEGIRDVDSGNVQNTGNIESEINANLILVNYMHVVDSCVVLNLSQKEAEALGVSDYYYQKAQRTVLEVNKAMKESIKEHPDWPVYLKGPKELREENDSIAVSQTRSEEPLPSGRLNAPDQAEVSKVFFAPSTVNAVEFLCLNRVAPVCRFDCKTKAQGQISGQQGFGYLGINKKLRAMLAASNTRAYVYFQTTDPFGGTCSWKSYYQGID